MRPVKRGKNGVEPIAGRVRGRARRESAFTLIEMMIVVVIIGIIINISIPSYLRARESARSKACIKNLKAIDSAKEQYALDNKVNTGAYTPVAADLYGTNSYIRQTPACPTVGATGYSINAIGTLPTCIIGANLNSGTWDDHVMTQ